MWVCDPFWIVAKAPRGDRAALLKLEQSTPELASINSCWKDLNTAPSVKYDKKKLFLPYIKLVRLKTKTKIKMFF
jgi:hypothetical protein